MIYQINLRKYFEDFIQDENEHAVFLCECAFKSIQGKWLKYHSQT